MNLEELIRGAAARGMSRNEARKMLGLTRYKMNLFLSALPDISWPAQGRSRAHIRGNQSKAGVCPPNLAEARKARLARLAHTVQGVTGTISELARHFGVISASVARARVRNEGMSVEDAVTLKARPSASGVIRPGKRQAR